MPFIMTLIFCPISQPFLPPLLSLLLSFSHGRRFDGISSRSRRIRRGKRRREKRYRRPKAQPSLYLSTARFIVGKPADFFSFLFWAATDRSPGSSTTIIRRIFRVPDRFENARDSIDRMRYPGKRKRTMTRVDDEAVSLLSFPETRGRISRYTCTSNS